ncbi:MAG TPA: hypothetical protein VMF62_12430 [Acetobacteraceae bacterium]|jgi:hypothetical protein|nr:hypothetical protein [Acetobacteraceae bacterium]
MNKSDTILEHPVELADSELDTVSAGTMRIGPASPIVALEDDIKRLVTSILSDLGLGRSTVAPAM